MKVDKETILVVDDNRQLADFIAYRLLPEMGYSAHTAYTGQSALDTLKSITPALILLDQELPDMSGLSLLKSMNGGDNRIPTVLLTAHGSEQIAAEAFRLGVEDYLIKPVEPEQLEATVTRALTVTRLRREAERLNAELKEQVEWLSALSKVGRSLTSTLDLDDVLRRIVEEGVSLTGAEEGFLALLDHTTGQFYLRAVKNIDESRIKTTRMPVQDSLVGIAIRSGRPVRRSTGENSQDLKISTGFLVHSLLYVPIFSRGKPVGVLAVDNRMKRRKFNRKDEVMLISLVDYAAVALENAALFEQSRRELAERKRVEGALRVSEERYALAARGANDGIWDWDLRANQIYFSPRWKNMLGFKESEIGADPDEWFGRVHPQDLDGLHSAIAVHLRGVTPHLEHDYRILHKDGVYRWVQCRGSAVRAADQNVARVAGSQTDITGSKEAEDRLRHDAFTDDLTQLPNRAMFIQALDQVLTRPDEESPHLFAVLYLDLDRFKYINDSLGHPAGDELLISVAELLKAQLRENDIVARLGGDEFVILLDRIRSTEYVINVSQRIIELLSQPIYLEKYSASVSTSASIGIVLSTRGYERSDDVLRDADIAMYAAKAKGKGTYELFDPSMHAHILRRVALEADLHHAVEKGQLQLYYQPVLNLVTGMLIGFEALVQWRHPEYGLLPAAEFVPLAQEIGLIIPMDWWVLEEAFRQAGEWQSFGFEPPLLVQVNLTSSLMDRSDLLPRIREMLSKTGLNPKALNLEVNENIAAETRKSVAKLIQELRDLGIGVQIDNFGTGQSSLLHLKCFPVSGIKIDRSYVAEINADADSALLVRMLVGFAHRLGLQATGEGVETGDQLEQLRAMGCDCAQGYLFSPPLSPQGLQSLLEKHQRGESILLQGASPAAPDAYRPETYA